ncbi:unnamed protein product [Cuscuta epithymum]|uniref:Uncharacterized protein n=1 Tax=Cuscuta epithymum TaxID=186058 RepID=A0AAV0GIS4_9ASTE|nr:unnamed protein product [Cuscuta epithymum]
MDVSSFAALKKKLAKEPKKKEAGKQKPVDGFFPRVEGPLPQGEPTKEVAAAAANAETGGSQAEELTRKRAGKALAPPEMKKQKKGAAGKKDAPIIIAGEQPSFNPSAHTPPRSPPAHINEEVCQAELIQFPVKAGTSVLHGTLHPVGFLRGVMASKDRSVLARYEDDILDYKVASYSTMAALAASEQARRVEQLRIAKIQADEALKKADVEQAALRKKLSEAEEALRLEKEGTEQRLKDAEAKGKAAAEEAAAAIARTVAEASENEKAEAIADARKEAVEAFLAEGWTASAHEGWVASVVEQKVDSWVKGPGAMWLAQKGKDYYDGGEFFTQNLIYRRLARHLHIEPKAFDPAAYGLPPLQPDVRVPLPEGEERPDLEDSELLQGGDDEEAEDDATSKPKEDPQGAAI